MKSLAVKYRPKAFDEVTEQSAVIDILENQLATKSHQNCYLFTGGAGTGKTTCARIFANNLNAGHGNAIEIDAASNNGVDNVREIRDSAAFKSVDAKYKVFIIDECHMLSTGAWNALLKIFEEPPASTVFIMCTTDPSKIPATILSRVQRFDFKRLTFNAIVSRLKYILLMEQDEDEELEWSDEAIEYIAKLADGGMRDAITLMDKCISYSSELSIANVMTALGTADYDTMKDLLFCIFKNKTDGCIKIIEDVYLDGVDLKQFIRMFINFILDICKYSLMKDGKYMQLPISYIENDPGGLFDECITNYDRLIKLLNAMIRLNNDIKWETSPKLVIQSRFMVMGWEGTE